MHSPSKLTTYWHICPGRLVPTQPNSSNRSSNIYANCSPLSSRRPRTQLFCLTDAGRLLVSHQPLSPALSQWCQVLQESALPATAWDQTTATFLSQRQREKPPRSCQEGLPCCLWELSIWFSHAKCYIPALQIQVPCSFISWNWTELFKNENFYISTIKSASGLGVNFAVAQISLRNVTIQMWETTKQAVRVLSASHKKKKTNKNPQEQKHNSPLFPSHPDNLNSAFTNRPKMRK